MSWTEAWFPRHLVERGRPLPAPGEEERFAGSLLRFDIPGFTARAEAVGGRDRIVSEDLAQLVTEAFGPILQAVEIYNGSVAGLEGDAVLALFSGSDHAARARAAHDEVLARRPSLHAAIATGEVRLLHLEGAEQRVEVLHGPALDALEALEAGAPLPPIEPGEALVEGEPIMVTAAELERFVPPALRGSPVTSAAHRRVVTLFFDLPISEAVGAWPILADEAAAHAVTLLKARARRQKLVVLGVAGAPIAHQDDLSRALAFALAARDRLADEKGTRVRISMTEGVVIGLVIGDETRASYDVFGDDVNVASRLLDLAKPGEIVATATTLDRTQEVRTGPVRMVNIRGKSRPVPIRTLEGAAEVPVTPLDTVSFRPHLRQQLQDLLDARAAVAIVGAPGMGKRRLWSEYAARFQGRVLRASCHDYGAVRPLVPFVGLLRRLVDGTQTRAGVAAALAAQPGMNDRTTAALAALVANGSPQLAAVASALRQLLAGMGAQAPTLLVIEDWQWADVDTRVFVDRLVPDLARLRLRLIITASPRRPLPEGIAELHVPPLDRNAARVLVERVGKGELDPRMIDQIVERGAGNPRDLVALAEAAVQAGDDLPPSLEAWYAGTVDALPEAARDVIERAAIVGRTVERGLLRRLCADVPGAEEGLGYLLEHRLLVAADAGRLRFERDPMREIVYMRMPSDRRRRLHGRYGRVLQHRAEVGEAVPPETVAWHLARSDRPAEAVAALVEASKRALAHGRPRLAVSHAEQAARIARMHAPTQAADVQRQLGDAMLRVGRADLALDAFRAAGDPQLAAELAGALLEGGFAREALAAVGDTDTPSASAVRARSLALLGDPGAAASWQKALTEAKTPQERTRALRFYGAELAREDRHEEAVDVLGAAVQSARAARDNAARAEAEELLGRSLAVLGRLDEALALQRDALAIREGARDTEGTVAALRSLARSESLHGDHHAALGHLLAARAMLRELGNESKLQRVDVDLAEVRIRRGDLDHARQHLARANELNGRSKARHALLLAWVEKDGDQAAATAHTALERCTEDHWRAGVALATALVAKADGTGAADEAMRTLQALGHKDFLSLAEQLRP